MLSSTTTSLPHSSLHKFWLKTEQMSYSAIRATTMTTDITAVDCQKQVRTWRLLRSLLELLIPTCNCAFIEDPETKKQSNFNSFHRKKPTLISPSSVFTGTIFGSRRGKVSLCIQTNPNSINPVFLLELAIPTSTLAREMQGGVLRIALEASGRWYDCNDSKLLSMPLWVMYCNGRRVGYAIKRAPKKADLEVMKVMRSVDVGAGLIGGRQIGRDDDDGLMYLRANFSRVCGPAGSESFHLIDPDGNIGQELSIFFFRPR